MNELKVNRNAERMARLRKRQRQESESLQATTTMDEEGAVDSPAEGVPMRLYNALKFFVFVLMAVVKTMKLNVKKKQMQVNKVLNIENIKLHKCLAQKTRIKVLNQTVVDSVLKTDDAVRFFTGIGSITLFKKLHDYVGPIVKRRWQGQLNRSKFKKRILFDSPKKYGPGRKLHSTDEFLLTLMKLRLGLLNKDLAKRFDISKTLCTRIFHSWLVAY